MGKFLKWIDSKIEKHIAQIWGIMLAVLITLVLLSGITFFGICMWTMVGGI